MTDTLRLLIGKEEGFYPSFFVSGLSGDGIVSVRMERIRELIGPIVAADYPQRVHGFSHVAGFKMEVWPG
jgi:hypothetical protein